MNKLNRRFRKPRRRQSAAARVTLTLIIALVAVVAVSLMPLEKWTGGRMHNFNLLGDILPDSLLVGSSLSSETIDPELLKEELDMAAIASERDSLGRPLFTDTIISPVLPAQDPDGTVVIEDYTAGSVGLFNLRRAMKKGRLARIAVVGDSYIEGDVMTQDFRALMQRAYGGSGVGYVSMHSDFPGFRRSVRQAGEGWNMVKKGSGANASYMGLMELYGKPKGNATASYKGSEKVDCADTWDVSRFLCIAPMGATVMTRLGGDGPWTEHRLEPSTEVQSIELRGATSQLELKSATTSLIGLGVWLDTEGPGVSIDCMSSRGHSGISLASITPELCRDMARHIDYDLVVLEFGINAMSSGQKAYTTYGNHLVRIINNVRQCYPNADILLMGIGDRGERRGGKVQSMASADAMVTAQRDAARRTHVMFWDTRRAMGGADAIVAWSNAGDANKDYVHLTHKGGRRLAGSLFEAVKRHLGTIDADSTLTTTAATTATSAPKSNAAI